MTQSLELRQLGLTPLSENENVDTNGGLIWWPVALTVSLIVSAVDNFGDIRNGLSDGWNGSPRH